MDQLVKNLPAMEEIPVRFLGREDPLEKELVTLSSILGFPGGSADKEPPTWRPGFGPWVRRFSGEGKGYPPPVFWPGEYHGLYMHSPRGHKESDMTEQLLLLS